LINVSDLGTLIRSKGQRGNSLAFFVGDLHVLVLKSIFTAYLFFLDAEGGQIFRNILALKIRLLG